MMFLQMTTKEKMDTLDSLYCAPMGKTAEDYGFVAEVEELMAHGDEDALSARSTRCDRLHEDSLESLTRAP